MWYLRHRRDGGTSGPFRWEFGGLDTWQDASAPGKVGKRIAEGLLRKPLPDAAAGPINNLVHWGYGVGWGALYGLMAGSLRQVRLPLGPFFGTGVWLSAHVAYGSATAAAFELMAGADARSRGRMA